MSYNSKYKSSKIEEILDSVGGKQDAIADLDVIRSGAEKGATALQSIPSEYVTETELTSKGYATTSALNDKVDKVSGKGLSTEDFTSALKAKLEGLSNYDDTTLANAISGLETRLNTLVSGDASTAIESFNEIMAFLDGIKDTQDLAGIIASIEQQIAGKYTKPSGGIPASDLAPDVFLQGEKGEKGEKGDKGDKGDTGATGPQGPQGPQGVGVTSVVQTTTSSADGGSNVVTVTLSDGKTSTFTVKNGSKGSQGEKGDKGDTGAEGPQGVQGIQGIQGPKGDTGADGAQGPKGDQGEQGPKGDKGDKGDTGAAGTNGTNGVSVSSVKQTTTSTADGGTNVVTVTLSNGTTSTFNVKNGSKGSNGTNGTNGTNGATFTPSVDSAGNLSWTNNGGLTNPPTVNIKGPKGDKGDAGSGGSGGGSGAYSQVNHGTSDTTFTLTPNTFHVWEEVSALTLTLGSETAGVANEFLFQFASGATATSLTLPDDIKWANDSAPTIAENMIYQVSILKGMASVLEFDNTPNVVLITFYYSGSPYSAEEGMTWEQWCNSTYNSTTLKISGGMLTVNGVYPVCNSSGMSVYGTDVIIENEYYDMGQSGGG